jgi:diguanylate cyclase (GGDEF)-like protein/PAS domain S-box-containing protein
MNTSEASLFQMAFMQAWNSVVITSADKKAGYPVEIANPAFCKMTGYSLEELRGHTLKMLQGPETDSEVIQRLRECLDKGQYFEGMTTNYRKDKTSYLVRWNISPVFNESGEITHFVSVQQDMTDYMRAEQRSRILARALNSTAEPILVTDAESKIIFTNNAFSEVAGYKADELIGKTPAIWKSGQHDENFYTQLKATLKAGHDYQAIFVNKRKNGDLYSADQSISPIFDEKGNITHFISVSKDVTERIKTEQALLKSATLDKLTGLYNRNHGDSVLKEAYANASANHIPLNLIMCDIDHFKKINDNYGHPVGDEVLKEVAAILRKSVRSGDAVIRWGGEEFMILLMHCNQASAVELAERIRSRVENHRHDKLGQVTISLGLAALQTGESLKQCISRCDTALYQSKHEGRNRLSLAAI